MPDTSSIEIGVRGGSCGRVSGCREIWFGCVFGFRAERKVPASSLTRGPSRHLRLAQGLVHPDEGPVPYKLPRGEGPPRLGS